VATGNLDAVPVLIDSSGQLGTINSSRRFKKDIRPMDQTSEAILALKPVTFHYKDGDTKKARETSQYGLIAEDVAAVNPDLIVRDKDGEIYSVRYDAVNVMLLNEFLKEHKKVEAQQATIAELKSTVAQQQKGMVVLTAQLKEQSRQIQKVSAQLELRKSAPQTVLNSK
jgi:septal ring factor EnvC (AmiA/AmiB activator)